MNKAVFNVPRDSEAILRGRLAPFDKCSSDEEDKELDKELNFVPISFPTEVEDLEIEDPRFSNRALLEENRELFRAPRILFLCDISLCSTTES